MFASGAVGALPAHRFVAKQELTKIPFSERMWCSHVTIDRFNRAKAFEAISAAQVIKGGISTIVFPKHASRTGELLPFQERAVRARHRAQVPLVRCTCTTRSRSCQGGVAARRCRFRIRIGERSRPLADAGRRDGCASAPPALSVAAAVDSQPAQS